MSRHDYAQCVSSKVKVYGPNKVEMQPGGCYELGVENDTEERVVRLHLLSHFIDLVIHDICETSENRILKGSRIETLADDLFEDFRSFIEAGFDIFDIPEYYMLEKLNLYKQRPIVGTEWNAGPTETEEGLPPGWWWDHPGHAKKFFDFGMIIIDVDSYPRIVAYKDHDAWESGIFLNWIEIETEADYSKVFLAYPSVAFEIVQAAKWTLEQYK